jgi:chromosome segregation protein
MYLKNLTILGFKSFSEKTTLNFLPGITAVVGPNGCGKSNIADSVRWVLGEQSAKALRGSEMADVIFNGTDRRKPMGMAEVSLTIGDVDQEHLKAAGIELSYNEVTLTRRVFRDGVSEYYINKTPCRLKDIQQLFMGTGVGRTSYSIMAQGHITQLLSSRPEDRRQVFEEAAGITKFKSQKKEALRKLESTEQNLLRVGDLIREVKRQIGSLQRQAGKARRYKQFMQELQHLDTQLARHQFDVLLSEIQERQSQVEKLRAEVEVVAESIMRGEDEIGQLRTQMGALEHRIAQTQANSLELKSQIDWHGNRIHFNEERLRELDQQNSKALADIAQAEERRLAAEQELQAVQGRLTETTAKIDELRQSLQIKREALQTLENDGRQQQESLRQLQTSLFGVAQQLSRVRNEITALEMHKQANQVRLEKLSSEKIQLEEERLNLQSKLGQFALNVESDKLNVQTQRSSVEEHQARLRQLQQDLSRTSQELDQWLQRQTAVRSRLHVLEQLQADHEGFSAGTLAALKQAPHMLGALADRMRVPDEHIVAVESALGHHLQVLLTDTPEAAHQVLAELAARRQGRASIAPLKLMAQLKTNELQPVQSSESSGTIPDSALPEPAVTSNPPQAPLSPSIESSSPEQSTPTAPPLPSSQPDLPFAALPFPSLLSVVECDETVRPLLARLLGRALLAPDLAAATQFWQSNAGAYDLVTPSGELLNSNGVYTGGLGQGVNQGPSSVLGRKNQILELQTQLAQIQEQAGELSRQKGTLQSELTLLQSSLQQAQSELRTQEVAIATRQGEFRALENGLRLLEQKIETVIYEIQNLADRDQESVSRRQALADQLAGLEAREQELQHQLQLTTAAQDQFRLDRETAQQAMSENKVSLATEEQLCQSFRQQHQAHQHRLHELAQLADQRRAEIAAFLERRAQLESEMAESRAKTESLQHDRDQVNLQTADLVQQKQVLETDVDTRESTLRDHRKRHSDLQQHRGALDVELAQKDMAVQNLRERIQQKYQLRLDDVRSECITITIADSGPPRVQTLTPEEMAAQGAATDWGTVAEQVGSLQQRIDEMGPVNLVAIEEYEEAEQRFQFLSTQHQDLLQAKEQLLEVISRINVQTREMFAETFTKIRDNFRNLFSEVFGGGTADLQLVDEGDVLESGIEITARPPGKQLKSISLLSGGEQTMTAVSLLFAIYQVKPSPFCVLDELDAPLDESNINRFIAVLKRFLVHSQFIIITHNKRTIGTADVIYGITMQETGISKLVSMRFKHDRFDPEAGNGKKGNGNGHGSSHPTAGGERPGASPTGAPASTAGDSSSQDAAPLSTEQEVVTAK